MNLEFSTDTIQMRNIHYVNTQCNLGECSWTVITNSNGSRFGQQEAQNLRGNQEICPTVHEGDISKGNFIDMLEALAVLTSGLPKKHPNQYQVENALGFIGKYLFGEPLLIDLGYYKGDIYYGHGDNENYWQGIWIGKKGIDSKEKFLNSPDVQELAIREVFALHWNRISGTLRGQGKCVNDYLGQKKTFEDQGVSKTIEITLAGILASAHLRGPYGVADILLKKQVEYDEFCNSILCYMNEYYGYEITLEDFINHNC